MMKNWPLEFISKENFYLHIKNTISHYGKKLNPINLKAFNNNIIDPIKMIFDKAVYQETWENIIRNEIFRQRDKSSSNEIGYFHQYLFKYIKNCIVPKNGELGGWDVIYTPTKTYKIDDLTFVNKIFVEMKNKHNTMNSSSQQKTYLKMQDQLLRDEHAACFLVEAIAKKSQNITWIVPITEKGQKSKFEHSKIRKVSLDKFYEIVTGDPNSFYKICLILPNVIEEILQGTKQKFKLPNDTVFNELYENSKKFLQFDSDFDNAMFLAMYLLGFSSYNGFEELEKISYE